MEYCKNRRETGIRNYGRTLYSVRSQIGDQEHSFSHRMKAILLFIDESVKLTGAGKKNQLNAIYFRNIRRSGFSSSLQALRNLFLLKKVHLTKNISARHQEIIECNLFQKYSKVGFFFICASFTQPVFAQKVHLTKNISAPHQEIIECNLFQKQEGDTQAIERKKMFSPKNPDP